MILKTVKMILMGSYLDMKSDDEAYTNNRRDGAVEGNEERTKKEDVLIGTNIEIESD